MPTYKLTELATVERPAKPTSDFDHSGQWVEVGKVWLELKPLIGNERVQAIQVYSGATFKAVCRRTTYPIDTGYRLTVGGIRYEIQAAIDDGTYFTLQLTRDPATVGG